MPAQELRYRPPRRGRRGADAAVLYARFILLAITVGVTIYGVYQMLQVVRFASMTLLQGLMIFFLRGLAGLDRVRGGLGIGRCVEAARSKTEPGNPALAHGAGDADLQ